MVMADAHGVTKLAPAAASTREKSEIAKVGESAVKMLPTVNSDRPNVRAVSRLQLAVKAPSTGAQMANTILKTVTSCAADVVGT